jgi:predicted metal-dependent peptidase
MDLSFYGYFLTNINIIQDESRPTAWVFVDREGLQMRYNPFFMGLLNKPQKRFILIHELQHLLSGHIRRMTNQDPEISNVVMDQIINSGIITSNLPGVEVPVLLDVYNELEKQFIEQYKIEMSDLVLQVPPEYDNPKVYEVMYKWANKIYNERKELKLEYLDTHRFCNYNKKKSNIMNNFIYNIDMLILDRDKQEKWDGLSKAEQLEIIKEKIKKGQFSDSRISDSVLAVDIEESFIDGILQRMKNRGQISSNGELMLEKIRPTKTDKLKIIKRMVPNLVGGFKNPTYTRLNRKGIEGLRGNKKEGVCLNVLLDTSGSMEGDIEKVLSVCFQNNLILNLVQIDTNVQEIKGKGYQVINSKNELQKITINGLGGTELQPGIDYISNDPHLKKFNTLILTDGHCDRLSVQNLKKVMVVSSQKEVKITSNRNNYMQLFIGKNGL